VALVTYPWVGAARKQRRIDDAAGGVAFLAVLAIA